ncbi:hypothetical protein BRYFOR_08705 [Marvinbryantia formatexigens DSM 14469]|uniref:Uncharacterized protein n=1 Tax=Marvinbryantia formatexigens DSM 14469 TaxID=478749 RepID=C6LJ71_9FIRM|nr:hypothetical protein BRYFOR_08705 [Marvinbryantia formatexigens DSM 14469]
MILGLREFPREMLLREKQGGLKAGSGSFTGGQAGIVIAGSFCIPALLININVKIKAMKRNSTGIFESRKLPGDARQQRRYPELASERLPQILQHNSRNCCPS